TVDPLCVSSPQHGRGDPPRSTRIAGRWRAGSPVAAVRSQGADGLMPRSRTTSPEVRLLGWLTDAAYFYSAENPERPCTVTLSPTATASVFPLGASAMPVGW